MKKRLWFQAKIKQDSTEALETHTKQTDEILKLTNHKAFSAHNTTPNLTTVTSPNPYLYSVHTYICVCVCV